MMDSHDPQFVNAMSRRVLLLASLASVAACGLPQQGPETASLLEGAEDLDYLLINVDAQTTRLLGTPPVTRLTGLSLDPSAEPSNAVGIGDALNIRILEAGAGGLFATSDGGAGGTEFADVVVGRDGRINLPYVGDVEVLGQTPTRIQDLIVEKLAGKAIQPQALVRIMRSENNQATITGDVASPGPFALSLAGDRLSEAVAASGGGKNPPHETRVTVIRNGRRSSAMLQDILLVPANDIPLQRDDLVVLTHEPPRYTLTGAVLRPGTFEISTGRFSLLEAVSAAGGANDARANPSGVFLFRYEQPGRLSAAGQVSLNRFAATQDGVPTVYRFDLAKPETLFFAKSFQLTAGDAVYVSNADVVSFGKLLSLFDMGLRGVNNVQSVSE
jgi:polysaccharide biosynthesis/export protein